MNANDNIFCTVHECRYHCGESDCCSKQQIEVGSCGSAAHTCDSTCCRSFEERL